MVTASIRSLGAQDEELPQLGTRNLELGARQVSAALQAGDVWELHDKVEKPHESADEPEQ